MLTIYKASAGSGKTYRLALEYITMLLGVRLHTGRYALNMAKYLPQGMAPRRRPHSHILAITFTNKATAEMKSRIVAELDALSKVPAPGAKDSGYAATLLQTYGIADRPDARADLAAVAAKTLFDLLHDYSAFNVSTIDSFFQTILRTFARELDRQGDFSLELDDRYVVNTAMSLLMDDLNAPEVLNATALPTDVRPAVAEWFEQIAGEQLGEGKDFNVYNRNGATYNELVRRLMGIFTEQFTERAAEVRAYMAPPGDKPRRFADALRREMDDARLAEKDALEAADLSLRACGVDPARVYNLGLFTNRAPEGCLTDKGRKDLLDAELKNVAALLDGEYPSRLIKTVKGSPTPEEAFAALSKLVCTLRHVALRYHICNKLSNTLRTLRAFAFIEDYIERFRDDNNVVLLSDTNSLLRTLINGEDAPFIYERIGVELEHFLIDEFQDTSRMQWSNLRPLLGNSLASGNDNLIIGDVKQSIYRWRGGDSSLLGHTVAESDFPRDHSICGDRRSDNTNYRSAHTVVRFNNTIFNCLSNNPADPVDGYNGVVQGLADKTAGLTGRVEMVHMLPVGEGEPLPDALLTPDEAGSLIEEGKECDARHVAMERCALKILDQHRRGFRWRDIAVLCRRNSACAELIAYFKKYYPKIQVMSEDALMLGANNTIRLLVSILEIIDRNFMSDPAEHEEPGAVAERPVQGTSEQIKEQAQRRRKALRDRRILMDRFEFFSAQGMNPSQALNKALDPSCPAGEDGEDCAETPADSIDIIMRRSPANLVALIEAIIDVKVPQARRQADLAYITAFIDLAIDYSNNYNPSLHGFLEYWRTCSARLMPGAGQDAVTVTTVHKSKGLEWACVHLPLVDWDYTAQPSAQWFDMSGFKTADGAECPPLLYFKPDKHFMLPDSPFARQVREQVRLDTADNVNIAYVAFTRAVRELNIQLLNGGLAQRLDMAIDSYTDDADPDLLRDSELERDEDGNIIIGEPVQPEAAAEPAPGMPAPPFNVNFESVSAQLARLESLADNPGSAEDPDIGTPDLTLPAVDELTAPDIAPDALEAIRRGNHMHAILSHMRIIDDLDDAIRRESRDFTEAEGDEYARILSVAFNRSGPEPDIWFGPDTLRVLCEQSVYLPGRDENYRPDRIVWTAEGTIDIVDYKFTSRTADRHRDQVRGYKAMLQSIFPDTSVRGFVWYPERCQIIKV